MKQHSTRRTFFKQAGAGSLAAGMLPASLLPGDDVQQTKSQKPLEKGIPSEHIYNESYEGEHLNRIAFPIGGLGAGMFCIEGTGAISHMSIRNKPDVFNEPRFFAGLAIKNSIHGAKIIEGPVPGWKKFGRPDSGNGASGSTTGLPRFHKAVFKARFPFASIELTDDELPLSVEINAWSPFIPTDENNSSLPAGMLQYTITNHSTATAEAVFSYNADNFLNVNGEGNQKGKNYIRPYKNGFILSEAGSKAQPFLKK